jgi:hypothetical protein
MRSKNVASPSTLGAFIVTLSIGCGPGSDVPLTKAPAPTPFPTQELSKDPKKGGGSGFSGHMKRNPGADPLSR